MEFKMWPLLENGSVGQIRTEASFESDIIVPDSKPDIYRVLDVEAMASLSDYHIRKDKITFSGSINYVVFYLGEEDQSKIYTIEHSAPFSHMTDGGNLAQDLIVRCGCTVAKTVCDIKNSRKLSAGALLDLTLMWIDKKETDAIEMEEIPKNISCKGDQHIYDLVKASSEFEFGVEDAITFEYCDDFEIYDLQVFNDVSEIKAVNNKAVIKGQSKVALLYYAQEELREYTTEIPYTEIVDIENLSSDQILTSHFETAWVKHTVTEVADKISIDVEIGIRGSIWGYEKVKCFLADDMYSPDYSYDISYKKCVMSKIICLKEEKVFLKGLLCASDSGKTISRVHYCRCNPIIENHSLCDRALKISGNMECVAIYSDSGNNLGCIRDTVPFETELELTQDVQNPLIITRLSPIGSEYILSSPDQVQIRAGARISVGIYELLEQQVVCSFSLDKNAPIKKEEQPSIIIYYPDSQSELWEIAKKYNTTVDDIISVNSLDKDAPFSNGQPIIIPKKCIK